MAVQGNGDNARAAANEFLTGCRSSSGATTAPACSRKTLHLPEELKAHSRHLHVDRSILDYRPFYTDLTVISGQGSPGNDSDAINGLENSTIVFYSGEGTQDFFFSLRNLTVPLNDFSLGDLEPRYLWMLSCNVFAHGPRVANGLSPKGDFLKPQSFDPIEWSKRPNDHANAFDRWGRTKGKKSPLNHGLRLACGGSSHIGNLNHPTHLLWHYYSIVGLGPAESFLLGLYTPQSAGLPLCMSRGGDTVESSGLVDGRFVRERLKEQDLTRIYVEYPVPAENNDPLVVEATKSPSIRYSRQLESRSDEPKELPVLRVTGAPVPPILGGLDFKNAPSLGYGFRGKSASDFGAKLDFLTPMGLGGELVADGESLCIKRHLGSGAVSLSLRPPAESGTFSSEDAKARLRSMAKEIIKRTVAGDFGPGFGTGPLNGFQLREAQAVTMMVDSVPATKVESGQLKLDDITHPEKCTYLRLTSVYREGATEVPVFGEGGEVLLGLCVANSQAREGPEPRGGTELDACRREVVPPLSVSLGGRIVIGEKEDSKSTLKTRVAAEQEALGILLRGESGRYYDPVPRRYRWGYKAAPVYCTQKEMYIVYEFDFAPKESVFSEELAPVTIEVPAHRLPESAESIEDTWDCSLELPS